MAGVAPISTLSMELVDSLEAYFPAGSPVVHLLKAPAAFLDTEADHLDGRGLFKEGSEVIGVRTSLSQSLWMVLNTNAGRCIDQRHISVCFRGCQLRRQYVEV